jgi:hypothetical protein
MATKKRTMSPLAKAARALKGGMHWKTVEKRYGVRIADVKAHQAGRKNGSAPPRKKSRTFVDEVKDIHRVAQGLAEVLRILREKVEAMSGRTFS